jgi:hypothetical protein
MVLGGPAAHVGADLSDQLQRGLRLDLRACSSFRSDRLFSRDSSFCSFIGYLLVALPACIGRNTFGG